MKKLNNPEDQYILVGDTVYYFDMKAIDDLLISDPSYDTHEAVEKETIENLNSNDQVIGKTTTIRTYQKEREFNVPRLEMFRLMMEILLTYDEEMDDTLGVERLLAKTSFPFKISFNTLLNEGILKQA